MRQLLIAMFLVAGSAHAVTLLRLACGGPGGTDTAGVAWQADAFFTGGALWTNSGTLDVPYKNLRYATTFTYTFQLQPGTYNVTLKFVEPNKTAAGQRLFNVSVNGAAVMTGVDLFAIAPGALVPKDYKLPVVTSTGRIAITFTGTLGNAVVSGIQIEDTAPPPSTAPSYLTGQEAAMPASCPGPLVFYVASDTNKLFWCAAPGKWTRVGDVFLVVPSVALLQHCTGSGATWNCNGIYQAQIKLTDGSTLSLVGVEMTLTANPLVTWTDVK